MEATRTTEGIALPKASLPAAVAAVAATGMFNADELKAFSQAIASSPDLCLDSHPPESLPRESQEKASVPQVYVNAKQYHCIMRRRAKRAQAAAKNQQLLQRKPFMHESRHQHAQKRKRGPGGRFLTKKELAVQSQIDEGRCKLADETIESTDSGLTAVRKDTFVVDNAMGVPFIHRSSAQTDVHCHPTESSRKSHNPGPFPGLTTDCRTSNR